MEIAVPALKWFQFRQRIIAWRIEHGGGQLAVIDHASERSITILQKRYGYSREQAAFELKKHYSKAWLG